MKKPIVVSVILLEHPLKALMLVASTGRWNGLFTAVLDAIHQILTIGTSSFFTSSTARASFSLALFSVSSTEINTCRSSFKCSQFGLPRFCSSYITTTTTTIIIIIIIPATSLIPHLLAKSPSDRYSLFHVFKTYLTVFSNSYCVSFSALLDSV